MSGEREAVRVAAAPFVRLMKIYVVDYTNSHDQSQTPWIMEPGYTLRMGSSVVSGRDSEYAAATRRQFDQFPGLCLTVHEIHTAGDRLAMRFSEHGASLKHGGARAAWRGIGLYRWNGTRLVSNSVEQDYLSRAGQLKSGTPKGVEPPAIAPWDTTESMPEPRSEAVVRQWLMDGGVGRAGDVLCDDATIDAPAPVIVQQESLIINDLFSCGSAVAFHATQRGTLLGDFAERPEDLGQPVRLHMAGLLHVRNDRVHSGHIIRNRMELRRALRERE